MPLCVGARNDLSIFRFGSTCKGQSPNTLAQSLWLARYTPSLTLTPFPVQHDLRRKTRFRGYMWRRFLPTAGSYALENCSPSRSGMGAPCLTQNNRDPRGSAWVHFSGPHFWTPTPYLRLRQIDANGFKPRHVGTMHDLFLFSRRALTK